MTLASLPRDFAPSWVFFSGKGFSNMARGKIDSAGLAYILGGVPLMALTFVLIFVLVKYCGLPV